MPAQPELKLRIRLVWMPEEQRVAEPPAPQSALCGRSFPPGCATENLRRNRGPVSIGRTRSQRRRVPSVPKMKISQARFPYGITWLVRERDFNVPAKMDFGLLRLLPGSRHVFTGEAGFVVVLLQGRARVTIAGQSAVVARRSVFEQGPFTVSLGRDEQAEIQSQTASEWAVMRTTASKARGARLYRPADCAGEDRAAGLAQGARRRLVRTIFDYSARPLVGLSAPLPPAARDLSPLLHRNAGLWPRRNRRTGASRDFRRYHG